MDLPTVVEKTVEFSADSDYDDSDDKEMAESEFFKQKEAELKAEIIDEQKKFQTEAHIPTHEQMKAGMTAEKLLPGLTK